MLALVEKESEATREWDELCSLRSRLETALVEFLRQFDADEAKAFQNLRQTLKGYHPKLVGKGVLTRLALLNKSLHERDHPGAAFRVSAILFNLVTGGWSGGVSGMFERARGEHEYRDEVDALLRTARTDVSAKCRSAESEVRSIRSEITLLLV